MFNIPSFYGFRAGGESFDPDAAAFFARVTAAGGTLSATERTAVNTLVVKMKFDGIWNSMKAIYPMVGASAAACAQNLKSSSFTGSFTSGWTFASTGVTPNGTSAYMDPNLTSQANLSLNSAHISFYSRTNSASTMVMAGTQSLYVLGRWTNYHANNSVESDLGGINTGATTAGFFMSNRTTGTAMKYQINGTIQTDSTSTAATASIHSSNPLWMGTQNRGASGIFFNNFSTAWYSLGDGLTDTQASNFYTAVQLFNQSLNRQVGPQIVSDSDAQAYVNRVYSAGGTLSNTEANAVNQLTIDMKAANVWTAMKAVYPMVGSSAAACAQNLKSSSFTGTFTSGWTFASTGVTGNGTSAYMDTNFNPSINMINDSASMAVYNRTINPNNGRHGLRDNAGGTELICKIGTVAFPIINVGSEFGSFSFTSNGQGFIQAIRTSPTRIVGLQNSSLFIGSQNQYRMNGNFLISASNVFGTTPSNFSNQEIALFSLGDGLTDTQASNFYTAVQAFQTTLSRQI